MHIKLQELFPEQGDSGPRVGEQQQKQQKKQQSSGSSSTDANQGKGAAAPAAADGMDKMPKVRIV